MGEIMPNAKERWDALHNSFSGPESFLAKFKPILITAGALVTMIVIAAYGVAGVWFMVTCAVGVVICIGFFRAVRWGDRKRQKLFDYHNK